MTFRAFDLDYLTKLRLCLLFPVILSGSPEKEVIKNVNFLHCPPKLFTQIYMWHHHSIRNITNLF